MPRRLPSPPRPWSALPLLALLLACARSPQVARQPEPAESVTPDAPGEAGAPREQARLLPREGDTVVVIVHHVRPYRRAAYERWSDSVGVAAIERIMARRPEARRAFEGMWRLLPTEPSEDGTFAYLYLYPRPLDLKTRRTGIRGLLEASGMGDAEIEREFDRFLTFVRAGLGYENVLKRRGWTQPKGAER